MNIKFTNEDLKIFIWPVIGIVITAILLVAVIIPQIYSILKTNAEITEQEVLSSNLQTKAEVLESVNLNQYQQDFKSLSVALPSSPDVPSAISQLQLLAAESNVTIKSFGINIPSSTTSDNFQLRVDLEGNLSNINKFVTNLKSSSRVLVLNKIDISGSRSDGASLASVTLVAYFQPVGTALSPIDGEVQPLSKEDQEEVAFINKNVVQNQGVSEITTTGPKGKANPFQ